ncbi:MAG: FMN-binding negative transcriptional regulator [Rhodoferax sp.]|jgi:transcriptional regulator|nr:FMN-binding negative transcriptional regulator [Rhodoferax sp.]
MYNPSHFVESRKEVLHDLITHYPLGALITFAAQGLDANHIPFELDGAVGELGKLRAHVARQNDVWQSVKSGDEVLVVFRADEAYISPNWYPSKHEFHKQVPTWNYRVVHAHGRITVHDEERYVRGLVARLTRHHEASQTTPWKMGDAPQDYIDSMLKAIVGIEIDITRLVGKFKLSQNREERDRLGAADALIAKGDMGVGQAMRDALPPVL